MPIIKMVQFFSFSLLSDTVCDEYGAQTFQAHPKSYSLKFIYFEAIKINNKINQSNFSK